ncbi:MAG: hypothetical protein ACYTGL_04785 [Planctomycetota bacterium]|jgi:hypothetical protein
MNRRSNVALCASLVAVSTSLLLLVFSDSAPGEAAQTQDTQPFRGALLSADQATEKRLGDLKDDGFNAVVLPLHGGDQRRVEQAACDRVREAGLELHYWVEVAHCPELADEHPDWMASLQGHPEWRRLFSDPPTPKDGEVVKTYPWVPILSREPFDGQLRRVGRLLANRPPADGVFLNDLQGAPSACGCGNHLCRWTTDYGKRRTTTPLTNDAPSRFVAEIEKLLPKSEVIPVWTTECEEHDGADDGLCAGVGCFKGICWKAWTEQLMPVARQSRRVGALVPYRAFQRDLPIYNKPAGWIAEAMKTFRTMPARYKQPGVSAARLLAVVQGWDVSDAQIEQQIAVATAAGAGGHLVAFSEIDQSWKPRLHRLRR